MDTDQETTNKVIGKDFVIELAKYFMLFLETDFKKRKQPKRNLSSRMNKGLSVGLYLDKYPTLYINLLIEVFHIRLIYSIYRGNLQT